MYDFKVLIVAPWDDSPTTVSSYTGRRLYRYLRKLEVPVYFFPYKYSRKQYVGRILDRFGDDIIFVYTGHGMVDRQCGALEWHCKYKDGMIDPENYKRLKGHIYALCCWTAVELGRLVDELRRAKSYLSWRTPIYIFYNKPEHHYMHDWYDIYSVYPLELLKTDDPKQSFKKLREKMKEYIEKYREKEGEWNYATHYRSRLESNLRTAVLFTRG